MQFHHHGYVSADPRVHPAAGVGINRSEELPDTMDVLIVGAGPAGIITAAQLSHFPTASVRIIDRRPSRLEVGQADGIQARSVETFQAFGFAPQVIQEAYQITETAFWKPDTEHPENIVRTATSLDDEHGISEFPHLIVNQARIIDYFHEYAQRGPGRVSVDFGYEFIGLEKTADTDFPITVTLKITAGEHEGETRVVRAKYVVGADGARSGVRRAIGGSLRGDQAFHAWGVMDVLAITDFPDIRKKCAIQSHDGGNILHIPREGNHLFRMYVDLGEVGEEDHGKVRETTIDEIIAQANKIMHPYTIDVRDVAWHSVYEVAHRLTDRFDDAHAHGEPCDPNVFLLGDACHTHSAKAGQGMNVSMQDGWNLAWKLGYVLEGRSPESLLHTYSDERQVTSKNLIDFDKEWSTLMAKRPEEFASPTELEDFYVQTAEFPAGFMTEYTESVLTAADSQQQLASGFPIGKRFKSVETVRVSDAVTVHLGHHHRADGRYRVYAFADATGERLDQWAEQLLAADSPLRTFTPEGADLDSVFDVKAVYQQSHREVDIAAVSPLFKPLSGPFQLVDYEKVYAAIADTDIFAERGVSRDGAVVVVRPDHYVAGIFALDDVAGVTELLGRAFLPQA
ncbi:phenol 2-monooxygenase [Leucobacter exalbidus]|uniref:Phenol 2-monooxygenase n=1 Tax=Leucobacter exalbidus TaxID=662960 RepID=A0A940PQT4_9MICO|nr:phenol 2-monooxygenase [Leucobacter exalbidus]